MKWLLIALTISILLLAMGTLYLRLPYGNKHLLINLGRPIVVITNKSYAVLSGEFVEIPKNAKIFGG